MRRLDELYMECPFFGSRRMAVTLQVNRKRMALMPHRRPHARWGRATARSVRPLGHSDMQTTLRIYGHMIHGQDDEAVRKLEEYHRKKRPACPRTEIVQ
jgi:hypothetical protein